MARRFKTKIETINPPHLGVVYGNVERGSPSQLRRGTEAIMMRKLMRGEVTPEQMATGQQLYLNRNTGRAPVLGLDKEPELVTRYESALPPDIQAQRAAPRLAIEKEKQSQRMGELELKSLEQKVANEPTEAELRNKLAQEDLAAKQAERAQNERKMRLLEMQAESEKMRSDAETQKIIAESRGVLSEGERARGKSLEREIEQTFELEQKAFSEGNMELAEKLKNVRYEKNKELNSIYSDEPTPKIYDNKGKPIADNGPIATGASPTDLSSTTGVPALEQQAIPAPSLTQSAETVEPPSLYSTGTTVPPQFKKQEESLKQLFDLSGITGPDFADETGQPLRLGMYMGSDEVPLLQKYMYALQKLKTYSENMKDFNNESLWPIIKQEVELTGIYQDILDRAGKTNLPSAGYLKAKQIVKLAQQIVQMMNQ